MNVIFLGIDGVLKSIHCDKHSDIDKKIKILSEICKEYDCKIVIESNHKYWINEETLETDVFWLKNILDSFKEYGIECEGITPSVMTQVSDHVFKSGNKEDGIISYLELHPEIEHYCVIDKADLSYSNTYPPKLNSHLLKTVEYSNRHPNEEGLLENHKKVVGKILELSNKYK